MPRSVQEGALKAAGVPDLNPEGVHLYIDGPPKGRNPLLYTQFDYAVMALRPGDVLVIADAVVLGASAAKIREVLEKVGKAGATLYEASTEKTFRGTAENLDTLDLVARAQGGTAEAKAARARAGKLAAGAQGGAPIKLIGGLKAAAKEDWFNLEMSGPQVARKHGVSVSTLHRAFGGRGIPIIPPEVTAKGRKKK